MINHNILKFKDLSWFLKLSAIGGFLSLILYILYFLVGFFEGFIGG